MELASCGISIHWFFTKSLLNQCTNALLVPWYQCLMTISSATGYRCLEYTGTRHLNWDRPEILYWLNYSMNELSNQKIGVLRNVTLELSSLENTWFLYSVQIHSNRIASSFHSQLIFHSQLVYLMFIRRQIFSLICSFSKLNSILLNMCSHADKYCELMWLVMNWENVLS